MPETSPPDAGPPGTDSPAGGFAYLPALDGIRALAVAAVLAFHGGVPGLSGGFLGVDAFFVLSGFLITSLLLSEHARHGRIALGAFWARRARRLLPALLLVLATVATIGRWSTPAEEMSALRADAVAALAYVANWRMAHRGGDYFAATAAPSPLQHTWSLGIEEQFYLVWPLLVVIVLGVVRTAHRLVLLAICLAGAAWSAVAAGVLFDATDVNRAYYGTDTRAAALLLGCALAVALAGRPGHATAAEEQSRGRYRLLGALAVIGAATIGWLWTHATGWSPWLFRGGLAAAALGTAAVLAHAVVSPASPTARLLGLRPLVWLGRISYGVYLWHWPLFGYLNADRTGLSGSALFAVRCAATLAAAVASYVLVERPVRTGRWLRPPTRLVPALTGATAATTAVIFLATSVRPASPAAALAATNVPTAAATASAASVPPIARPGRKPGDQPRITFLGDSVAWSLGTYLPTENDATITVRAVQGCGIARLPEIRYLGEPHPNYPGCENWDGRWRKAVQNDDPDVAVVLLDRWELMDRRLQGTYRHVGQADFDAYLTTELDLAIGIAGAQGGHVVLLTAPYTRRAERPDGGLWAEDEPERVDAWNSLLRAAAVRHAGRVSVLDLNGLVCPDGAFAWRVQGIRMRSDGLHFTPEGVQQRIAPWLMPQLTRIARLGA